MLRKSFSLVTASLVILGTAVQTQAGGRAVECYEPYREPAVYDTVYESVLVNPGSRRVEHTAPIYGTRKRTVLISPERIAYETLPAVTRTHYRTVKVADGGYSWEWRIIGGRKVLCKIKHKARYERVAETVVVRHAQRQRVIIPARYAYETEQVLVRPGQRRVVETPASYEVVARQVLVQEGRTGWQRVHIKRHCEG